MVLVDFFYFEVSIGGYEYILVVMDYFMCYVQVYVIKDKFVKIVVEKIYNDFILWFGFFEIIYYDQGGEFENKLFYNLDKFIGVCYFRIILYYL